MSTPPTTEPAAHLQGSLLQRGRRLAWEYSAGLAVAVGASWLRVALAGTLRIDTTTPLFVVTSLLLGLGLAIACRASWRLVKEAPGLPPSTLLRWALPGYLVATLAAPITSTDFFNYLGHGLLQLAGENPFATGPVLLGPGPVVDLIPVQAAGIASPYGPVANLVFGAAAHVGELVGAPNWGTAIALKAMMTATALAVLGLAAGFVRRHQPGAQGAHSLAILAFNPLLAWEVSGQGHNDGLLVLALMLFVVAATQGRELLAVLALTAGTFTKIVLAPLLGIYLLFLLRTRGLRAVAYGAAGLAVGALLMLPYIQGFPGLGPMAAALAGTAGSRGHSLADLLDILLRNIAPALNEPVDRACVALCVAVCGVAFLAAAWRPRTVPQVFRGLLLFLLALDMTVPLLQPWYVTWLFPLALVETDPRWQRLIFLYGIGTVMQWTIQLDPLTTVAVNAYVAWRAIRLLREGRRPEQNLGAPSSA